MNQPIPHFTQDSDLFNFINDNSHVLGSQRQICEQSHDLSELDINSELLSQIEKQDQDFDQINKQQTQNDKNNQVTKIDSIIQELAVDQESDNLSDLIIDDDMLKDCEDFLYDIYTSSLQNSQAIHQNQVNTQKSNNIEEVKQEEAFDYYSYQKLNNQEDFHNQLPTNIVNNDQDRKLLDNAPVLHYVAFKAGMDSIDKEKINKFILEASSGSSYYKREIQRTEAAKVKADIMKAKIKSHQKNERLWKQSSQQAKQIMTDVLKDRDLTRTWMHIDMDMFYAAVEIRDNPELADKPVAIGSYSMVSTANYVARKFGVRSAMPGFIAKKLCPELIFIPNNMKKYSKVSKVFKGILEQYDPNYESLGSDEANLDITDYLNANNMNDDEGIQKLVFQIREQILMKYIKFYYLMQYKKTYIDSSNFLNEENNFR